MNSALQRSELVCSLVDLTGLAITHDRFEDAEWVLGCLRVLRPKLVELDTYEAWIAMKRRRFDEAIRILRNIDASSPKWALGKALMALCQFVSGDPAWLANANDVVENGNDAAATGLVRLLLDPEGSVSRPAEDTDDEASAPAVSRELLQTYRRA